MATSPTIGSQTPPEPAISPSSPAFPQTSSVLATSCSPSLEAELMRRDPRYQAARERRLAYQAALARGESLSSRKP
jgi:hypothetical protein